MEFKSDIEAVAFGLALAITAPSDEKAAQAIALVESIVAGSGMSEIEVAKAKKAALVLVEEMEKELA